MQNKSPYLHQPKTTAFTLIEIIIVVTLFGLFSTYGAINAVKLRERTTLENTAERIANELKSVKTAAINGTGSVPHGISFKNTQPNLFYRTTGNYPNPLETPISLPNSISINYPHNGYVIYELRTGAPSFGQNLNNILNRYIILHSSSFQIQIDFDAQGNPILDKPKPLP